MKIFTIVIIFVIHCTISFLLCFAFDKAKLWKNKKEPTLRKPSLNDLQISESSKQRYSDLSIFEYKEYINEIISPSHCYFNLLNEIKYYQNAENEAGSAVSTFFLQLCTVLLMTLELYKFHFTTSFLCFLIALGVCLISFVIIKFIYSKTLCIEHFYYDTGELIEEAKEKFEYSQENKTLKFEISEEIYTNNYIIDVHNKYLNFIKETVFFRYHLRKILNKLGFLLYFLFFFTIPKL